MPTNDNTNSNSSLVDSSAIELPDLSTLSIDDLAKLNDDPMHMIDFVEELDILQGLNKQLDDLMGDVETITGNHL